MSGWTMLGEELDRWHASGARATFWWRDDDAVDATPQLEELLRRAAGIPLSLAVIPSRARPELAQRVRAMGTITVFQHGWAHVSHLDGGLCEYPPSRDARDVEGEFADGRAILSDLFGAQAMPVFVPPWHAIDDGFLPLLARSGVCGISRKGPLDAPRAGPLFAVNAHVSPIQWSEPPAFAGDRAYLEPIVEHLQGRRSGRFVASEATGLLTHHLDQNAASFAFIERFAEVVRDHPGAAWVSARELFAGLTV